MEEENQPQRKRLTVEEFNRQGVEETESSLNAVLGDPNSFSDSDKYTFYNGRLESIKRSSSFVEIVLRGLVLVFILTAACTVFTVERLPGETYDSLNTLLFNTIPHVIAKVSLFFSNPVLLIVLFLLLIGLVFLYLDNERNLRLLKMSPAFRSLFHSVLLPIAIEGVFVVAFGGYLILFDDTTSIQDKFNIPATEGEALERKAGLVTNGLTRFINMPVVGDAIKAGALVSVISLGSSTIGTLSIFATVIASFLDCLELLFGRVSLRNLCYAVVLCGSLFFDLIFSSFFRQFTLGFVVIIVIHMIKFVDVFFDYFSVNGSVIAAMTENDKKRYPDYEDMKKVVPILDAMGRELRSTNNVVVYVGREVMDGGLSVSSSFLSFLNVMSKIFPAFATKLYKERVLKPLISMGTTESQRYVARLAKNLYDLNGAHVTVVTDCIDGNLELPPSATLVELYGNVNHIVCADGHVTDMDLQNQLDVETLVCQTEGCGKPAVFAANANEDAVQAAADAINALQAVNGAVVVIGGCENAVIRQVIINRNRDEDVRVFQIGRKVIKGLQGTIQVEEMDTEGERLQADSKAPIVCAAPRDVLFEIVDELVD